MNIRKTSGGLLLSVILFTVVVAADKTNFSGRWVMTQAEGIPADMKQNMKVTQDGDKVEIETDLFQGDNVQTVPDQYTLDGKEVEFKPAAPPNATGKRTASWLPNGRGILIKDETSVDGKVVSTVTRKWTLATDGKTLTVDYYIDRPNGTFESKRVFNKVE